MLRPIRIKLREKVVKGITLGIVKSLNQTNQELSQNEYHRNRKKHKRVDSTRKCNFEIVKKGKL